MRIPAGKEILYGTFTMGYPRIRPRQKGEVEFCGFVTIGPNETVTDTLELSEDHFAGMGQAGTYTLRYDYAYDGQWDETVARDGVKDVWRRRISSREVQILRE